MARQEGTVYQIIHTRVLSPTNTRGTLIVAKCAGGALTMPYPYELDNTTAHRRACEALQKRMAGIAAKRHGGNSGGGWLRPMVGGSSPAGSSPAGSSPAIMSGYSHTASERIRPRR